MKKTSLLLICSVALFIASSAQAAFTANISPRADITIKLSSPDDTITLNRDFMLTLQVESPVDVIVTLPDLRGRFSGFTLAEDFSGERIEAGTRARRESQWRLTPDATGPWRLAPFAVTLTGKTGRVESFATKAVRFPDPPPRVAVTGDVEANFSPDWIPPTLKTISLWVLMGLVVIGLGFLLNFLLKQVKRKIREYKMSPSERALTELARLMDKHLPELGQYKTFYVELTLVVRRYIERSYQVKASRQTTQEFLSSILTDSRFSQETVAELSRFLESADMIKFAGVEATIDQAQNATNSAKQYITRDAQAVAQTAAQAQNSNV